MQDFAARLLLKRREKGLSQAQVAEKLGINQSNYSRLERGEVKRIEAETIQALAQLFDVLPNDLMYGNHQPDVVMVDKSGIVDSVGRVVPGQIKIGSDQEAEIVIDSASGNILATSSAPQLFRDAVFDASTGEPLRVTSTMRLDGSTGDMFISVFYAISGLPPKQWVSEADLIDAAISTIQVLADALVKEESDMEDKDIFEKMIEQLKRKNLSSDEITRINSWIKSHLRFYCNNGKVEYVDYTLVSEEVSD